jgi:hypothetical protein
MLVQNAVNLPQVIVKRTQNNGGGPFVPEKQGTTPGLFTGQHGG